MKSLLFVLLLMTSSACMYAQDSLAIVKARLAASGDTIYVSLKLAEGWYTYGTIARENKEGIGPQATEIFVTDTTGIVSAGKVGFPSPKVKYDDGFEMDIETYHGTVEFALPLVWTDSRTSKEKHIVSVGAYLQLCNGKSCLAPTEYATRIGVGRMDKSE